MRTSALSKAAPAKASLYDRVMLAKPGIVALVLVSTLTGIYMGGAGKATEGLIFWTLLGVGLATAGACVLNNFIDRDIDSLMERTRERGLPAGTVDPQFALTMGGALTALSMTVLLNRVNTLSALLTVLASFIYVILYSLLLKRRTPLANQVGGLSGALPPVIGYAAVTGGLGTPALLIFLIVALWQQPHALSLALKYRSQYALASVPVVPAAKGVLSTKKRIFLYTALLLPASVLPYAMGAAGEVYFLAALTFGIAYLLLALKFLRSRKECDMFLFFYSIVYLTAVFTALVFDIKVSP